MLWKEDKVSLPNNKELALKRLASIEKRLKRLPEIKEKYQNGIQTFLNNGWAKIVPSNETTNSLILNYIPHHFVLHPHKPGKVRIVFDAAAKYANSSLNENLTSGPDLLNNLVSVLTRFRTGKIAMMSDIEQMFHQVLVPEKDQNSLRFLWRNQQSNIIEEYKFLIHFQGKTDSPCCCNWALRKCAENQEKRYQKQSPKTFIWMTSLVAVSHQKKLLTLQRNSYSHFRREASD